MKVLFDRLAPRIRLLARRLLGAVAAADDVVQETFLQVWRTAADFDHGRGNVVAWVSVIARTRALDRLRLDRRRLEMEGTVPLPPSCARPAGEDHGLVLSRLETLAGPEAEVVRLAFLSGLTHSEIAAELGMPLGTVKTRVRRGLAHLAVLLSDPVVPSPDVLRSEAR